MQLAYFVLGVTPEADDATIRQRYLALVKQYPPSKAGERFALISACYEAIKDRRSRMRETIFGAKRFGDARSGLMALSQAVNETITLETLKATNEVFRG